MICEIQVCLLNKEHKVIYMQNKSLDFPLAYLFSSSHLLFKSKVGEKSPPSLFILNVEQEQHGEILTQLIRELPMFDMLNVCDTNSTCNCQT